MQLRKEQTEAQGKKYHIRQNWVSFQTIPDLLKKAVRISEDASFYEHEGIDYEELKESIKKVGRSSSPTKSNLLACW